MKRRWKGGAAAPSSIKLVAHFMTCNFSVATPHTPSASWNKNTFNNFLTTSGGGKNTFYKLFDMQDQVDCCFYFWATTTPTMYEGMWPSAHDNDNATDDATHIFWMQGKVHIQRQKILFIKKFESFWGGKKYFLWFFCHVTQSWLLNFFEPCNVRGVGTLQVDCCRWGEVVAPHVDCCQTWQWWCLTHLLDVRGGDPQLQCCSHKPLPHPETKILFIHQDNANRIINYT